MYEKRITILVLVFALLLTGCARVVETSAGKKAENKVMILATTTSTQDSGLLDVLVPAFVKQTGYQVKTIAVGSGEALAMGARGEADVLLVHSPKAEEEFVAAGNSAGRKPVMYNRFVIVGPKSDPAKVGKAASAAQALAEIERSKVTFVSRGDDSGTYKKELVLWGAAGIEPSGTWYVDAGQGMGATLRIADEKRAYTLTDESTYLSAKSSLALAVIVSGDPVLKNNYSVIVVNGTKFSGVNVKGAEAFSRFVTTSPGRKIIADFGRRKFGKPLFQLKKKETK